MKAVRFIPLTHSNKKNNATDRESWGVGRDMSISLKLFLEDVIKRKYNYWDVCVF